MMQLIVQKGRISLSCDCTCDMELRNERPAQTLRHYRGKAMRRADGEGGERWYVAHTQPHRETFAALNLEAQHFRVFLPRFRKTVRHARQLRAVIAPVFPRYLFVALDLQRDRWRSVNGAAGVSALVGAGTTPLPAPVGVVEAMLDARDASGAVVLGGELRPGQKVRIVGGPFAGGHGVMERLDGKARVRVLLSLLGGEAPIVLDRDQLSAA